jgi:peptide/nickel transport system substrate-binding protein
MTRRPAAVTAAASATLVLTLALAGCGGNKASPEGETTAPGFNAAVGKVFNPSDVKGGTLRMANSGDWDSLDPADNYYGYEWTFNRFYTRQLVTWAAAPGEAGLKLVPDLAESLGKASDGAKTWTYTLRKGLKFEDGTPVTSKDVKYGVERSLDKDTFVNGPTYFNDFLDLKGYKSPYKDPSPDKLGLTAIETPDDQTIVFHLIKPFGGFDYFAQLPGTTPVPRAKDTGIKYKEHVVSTGPYKFESNQLGKKFTLVRNSNWDPSTDSIRKALPDRIEVALNVNAEDVDNRLLSGDLDVDVVGTGLQPATQGRVLGNPDLKKNADSASQLRLWYTSVNPDVAPLDNVHCRKAILYAVDHTGYQNAYGGPAGGDIATNMLPPLIPGAQKTDLYNFNSKPTGDLDSAKKELTDCGQPNGFSTNMAYRAERPKEKALAESMQQSLAKAGIKLTLKPYPQGDYFALYAGKPDYAKKNGLGLMANGWGADWPDGFGFISQITDSRTIRASGGNYNLSVKLPEVDKLLDDALVQTDTAAREKFWPQVDRKVMENALVLPGVWAKTLLYRPPNLTNVYVSEGEGGYYDYVSMGVKK